MRLKLFPKLAFAILLAFVSLSAHAQVNPTATAAHSLPIKVGAALSAFNADYGSGTLLGGTLWIDVAIPYLPDRLRGLSLEAEARDLSLNRSSSQPPNLREDVVQGGALYSLRRYENFRPYAKALIGYGNVDYTRATGVRGHDSRTVTSLGGGAEYRAIQNIWLRVDYEYQFWPDFWKNTNPAGQLNPNGFSFGASYDLSHSHSR